MARNRDLETLHPELGTHPIPLPVRNLFFDFWEGLRIALRALHVHKLRSALTTIGIVIGIVTVTAMFTVINGLERGFERSVAMLGNDVLYVEKMPWFAQMKDIVKYRNRPDIKEDLIEVIQQQARYVEAVAPSVFTGRPVRYRDRALYGVFIQGSTPAQTNISDIDLTEGRWYNDFENRTARNVCIVGAEVAENLFPNEIPIGKQIRVGGHRFEVIGVLAEQGKFLGLFSFDEQIQLPYNTFKKLFGSRRSIRIEVKAASGELELAQDELTGILRAARGVDALDEDNFAINRQESFRDIIAATKATIYAIGIFLTALALVVGGIGVMNIMFVSVKERTKEIGIRKAVGAKRRTILIQFLIEAVIVCMVAGLIGVAISAGVAALINTFFTAYLSFETVVLAFSICVGVGIVFGLVPAWSAAKAEPIEALRYE